MKRKALTHEEVLDLAKWAEANKEDIQKKVDDGHTIIGLAANKGVPVGALRKVLTYVGIQHGRGPKKQHPTSSSILTVLARVCNQLDINHDEIKPYL